MFATLGGLIAPAPSALAETTTSCPSAVKDRVRLDVLFMASTCAGVPDQGAPYVFRIGTLFVWRLVGLDVVLVATGPATATCAAYSIQANGTLKATGCTITR